MNPILDSATWRAVRFQADAATAEFYTQIHAGHFRGTRCDACGHIPFPPRLFCPKCGHEAVTWVDLPRQATLHAFSQQSRSLRFSAPDVLGLVELEGIGLVLTRIDAPIETLSPGLTVEFDVYKIDDTWSVHQFRPSERSES